MWQPKDEDEIITILNNGNLEETVTFEAKSEVHKKNAELAKDVAAMANSSGGVILFGVKEDESKRLTIRTPFELQGTREKIEQVIRTSISEVPRYSIKQISTKEDSSKGYLVLTIEPSERAPHMVTVGDDKRYYARSGVTIHKMTESEVARLYERRNEIEADLRSILDELINEDPLPDETANIHLHMFIKPVLGFDSIFESVRRNASYPQLAQSSDSNILQKALETAVQPRLFMQDGYHYGISLNSWWQTRIDGYFTAMGAGGRGIAPSGDDTLHLRVNFDGSAFLFCGWAGSSVEKSQSGNTKYFFRLRTAILVARFAAFLGEFFTFANYYGSVAIGVALTNLKDSIDSEIIDFHLLRTSKFYTDSYKELARFSASELKEDPKDVAARLLSRLYNSIASSKKDLFRSSDLLKD